MYTRRRILAVLVVLLLLGLLLPRACQALMGSDGDAGGEPSGGRQAGAAGTETGTGAGEGESADNAGPEDASPGDAEKDQGADEAKDEPSDRGAPFLEDRSDGENDSGGDEAAPDLLALVAPTTTVAETSSSAGEEGGSVGGSSGAGSEPQAEQPISENQFALAASPAPAQQPSSGGRPAPTRRSGPAETAAAETAAAETAPVVEQDAASRSERIRARADRLAATPVAEPAALRGSGRGQAVVERQVVVEPVAPAPAPVPAASFSSGPDFAPTQVGAVRGVRAVPAALPAGPRLRGVGPTGTPGPAF